MKWTRTAPGVYAAGPYLVERIIESPAVWRANGPGVLGVCRPNKSEAQKVAQHAAEERALGFAVPVIGDIVLYDDRRGQISSILPQSGSSNVLYCIMFARGKRLCLFRQEFAVIVP